MNRLSHIPAELIFWIAALVLLAAAEPVPPQDVNHFTFCPLASMGLSWCPGCGLGRSITQLFHGHVQESMHYHWLGIPAVLIIGWRVIVLGNVQLKREINKNNKEKDYV
jgi:uncharacterized membrane protein